MSRTSAKASEEVRALLVHVIDSFEKLELVRVLRARSAPQSVAALGDELGLSAESCIVALRELSRGAMLLHHVDSGLWELTVPQARRSAVDALYALYERDRIEVMTLMSEIAIQRVRAEAARTFADAFLLRRERRERTAESARDDESSDEVADDKPPGSLKLKPTPR